MRMLGTAPESPSRHFPSWQKRLLWLASALLLGLLAAQIPLGGSAPAVLGIVVFAMVVWVSETIPLAVTALASSALLVVVAGMPSVDVFAAYFDPIIVLLLGGFFLGVALSKHGLDVKLAAFVMRRVGSRPATILLAIMATTATFSMWISNTASTAIMLPIALGIVTANPGSKDNLARCLVLGVAFSANIGGIATPIGTTANPIAIRFLAEAGAPISFFGWMARAVPLVVALMVLLWWILLRVYPIGTDPLHTPPANGGTTTPQRLVMGVFFLTVLLWLTTDLHGVPASLVAVVPIVLMAVLGVLGEEDIYKVGWPTLLLIGGGLALGDAVTTSGLDATFADAIAGVVGNRGGLVAFAAIAAAALLLTVFASNTAAAVIMIPIVLQLATGWNLAPQGITMLAAAALSLDFLVPVGTPPNAMAYGTGHVSVAQMAKVGVWASLAGLILATGAAWWFW